jgi:hypothetical protein
MFKYNNQVKDNIPVKVNSQLINSARFNLWGDGIKKIKDIGFFYLGISDGLFYANKIVHLIRIN